MAYYSEGAFVLNIKDMSPAERGFYLMKLHAVKKEELKEMDK